MTRLPRHPVWPTIALISMLAVVGTFIWGMISFIGSLAAASAAGPFAWITLVPVLTTGFLTAAAVGVVAIPIWTVAGGQIFSQMASGSTGTAAKELGVTFFSHTHPITRVTQTLAKRMDLPPIAYVGWFASDDINAFAMGNTQRNALIAVSKGAVERLTKQELIAIIGHELGHVASNDMARMTHARGIQEALTFFLIFRGLKTFARCVFTPLSELELLRFSRAREFTADEISAMFLGADPMISALKRLSEDTIRPDHGHNTNVMMWSSLTRGGSFDTQASLELRIHRFELFKERMRKQQSLSTAHGQS